MPAVLGYGAALATILGAFNYTGGRLTGPYERGYVDEVERKVEEVKEAKKHGRWWKGSVTAFVCAGEDCLLFCTVCIRSG